MTVQPTTTMPTDVNYGKVVGRFILAVGDASDPDRLPDATPTVGNITFTPAQPNFKANLPVPTTVVRSQIRCNVDGDGNLIDPQNAVGVWLVTGIYKVNYNLNGVVIPGHNIEVLSSHDDSNPLDLTNAIPVSGTPITLTQYEELSARIDGSGISVARSLYHATADGQGDQIPFVTTESRIPESVQPDVVLTGVHAGQLIEFFAHASISSPQGGVFDVAVVVNDEPVYYIGARLNELPGDNSEDVMNSWDFNGRIIAADPSWIVNNTVSFRMYYRCYDDPGTPFDPATTFVGLYGEFWVKRL